MKLLLYIVTIIVCIQTFAISWRPFNVNLNDITCFSKNSSIVPYINCSMVKDGSNKGRANLNIKFAEDLEKPIIDTIFTLKRISQPDFVLINTSFDACAFFENSNVIQMMRLIREEIYSYSDNFPKECPLKKNSDVNVKNYYFKADNLPSYVPECQFSIKFKLSQLKQQLLETTIMGAVENKIKLRKQSLKNTN